MARDRGIFWLSLVDQDYETFQGDVPVIFERPAEHFHITLQYNVPLTEEIAQFLWKEPIPVQITANCFNDRIQAVRVQLPDSFRNLCQNVDPHMTISMVQGAKPVQSNVMLGSNHVEQQLEVTLLFRAEFSHFS